MSTQRGSSLLVVLVMMTIVLVVITQRSRSMMFNADVARARAEYEQRFWATQGLFDYAVAVGKHNQQLFEVNNNDTQELVLIYDRWSVGEATIEHNGRIVLTPLANRSCIGVQAVLMSGKQIVMGMQGKLKKDPSGYELYDWHMQEVDEL